MVGIQDPRLEGALHLLLVQQQLRARARAGSARLRVPSTQEDASSSPPAGSGSESEAPGTALSTEAQPDGWSPQLTGQCSPPRKETQVTTQDCPPDKPLDLSDRGRCRDIPGFTGQPLPRNTTVGHTHSPQLPALSRPKTHSPHTPSNGSARTRAQEPEEHSPPKVSVPALSSVALSCRMAFTNSLGCLSLSAPSAWCQRAAWLPCSHWERTAHLLQPEDAHARAHTHTERLH